MSRKLSISLIKQEVDKIIKHSIIFLFFQGESLRGIPLCFSKFIKTLESRTYKSYHKCFEDYEDYSISHGKVFEHYLTSSQYTPDKELSQLSWAKQMFKSIPMKWCGNILILLGKNLILIELIVQWLLLKLALNTFLIKIYYQY